MDAVSIIFLLKAKMVCGGSWFHDPAQSIVNRASYSRLWNCGAHFFFFLFLTERNKNWEKRSGCHDDHLVVPHPSVNAYLHLLTAQSLEHFSIDILPI